MHDRRFPGVIRGLAIPANILHIRTQGICGDNALELRDARNVAIDELSKYVKIDVKYSNEYIDQYTTVEKLSISLAGTQPEIKLIDGIYGTQFMMNEP